MRRIAFAFVLSCSLARADTYVLCAGVERYDDQRISPLRYAVADAKSVAALFRASGVPRDNLVLLTSDATDLAGRATRSSILSALERILERAGANDRFIFFFAGHGVEEGGERYLLPVDSRRSLLSDTALPFGLIERALEGVQAGEMLFLLDTCRNDPNSGRADADAALTEGLSRGLRPKVKVGEGVRPPTMATLLACDAGQRAWEDVNRGHGAFTACLLDGCRGSAADGDGRVYLGRLSEYVAQSVQQWAARAGKLQRPRLLGPGADGMLVLIKPVEPLITITAKNEPLAQLVAELADQTGAQIVLGEGIDGGLPVSGRLEGQPLGKALTVLTAAYRLRVRKQEDVYILDRPGESAAGPGSLGEPTGDTLVVAAAGDGHYRKIGDALKRVKDGGRILVRPGVYVESLTIKKAITIQADGPADTVILTSREDSALKFECAAAAVGGLTILQRPSPGTEVFPAVNARRGEIELVGCDLVGGKPTLLVSYAATQVKLKDCTVTGSRESGLKVEQGARVTAEHCAMFGNTDRAMDCSDSSATFVDCIILNNGGDGLAVWRARLEMERCTVRNNCFTGVWLGDKSTGRFTDSKFNNNGRGLHVDWSDAELTGCEIKENHDGIGGVGDRGSLTASKCLLEGNRGTGVWIIHRVQVTLTDCEILGSGFLGICSGDTAVVNVARCKIKGGNDYGVRADGTSRITLEACEILDNRAGSVKSDPGARVETKDCVLPK